MCSRGVHMNVVCEVRLGEDVRLVDSWYSRGQNKVPVLSP